MNKEKMNCVCGCHTSPHSDLEMIEDGCDICQDHHGFNHMLHEFEQGRGTGEVTSEQMDSAIKTLQKGEKEPWFIEEFNEKYHYQDGCSLLLNSPNHFQTYDVTLGIKSPPP